VYFAHKDFLFSVIGKSKGCYIARKEDGYTFEIPKEVLKKYYKPVKKISKEAMARGYREMAMINLKEADAAIYTYNDGMEYYE
jgi:hypothetical protein